MIRDFINHIGAVDVARPNKYTVKILKPPVRRNRYVEYMAESVSFPGQNLRASTDLLRYGPQREVAHAFTYGPFSMTFICTTGQPEKKFFENWQDHMVNKESWEARFYEEYISNIELISLDRKEEDSYKVTVYEAYPKTINSQEYSYGANGAYQTVTIEFAFRWWDSVNIPPTYQKPPFVSTPYQKPKSKPSEKERTETQIRASDRHPPIIDETFSPGKPVPNPADQAFFPSPAQPVATSANPFGDGAGRESVASQKGDARNK